MGVSRALDIDENVALAWLAQASPRKRVRQLIAETGSARAALCASNPPPRDLDAFRAALEAMPHRLVTAGDPEFPPLLREIPDVPLVLYVAGDPLRLSGPAVAVIGARRCSRAGADCAEAFARDLAALGLLVVSGLAMGIDAAAHRGALQTGATAAVLGTGLERIYPARHRALAEAIVQSGGVVVSEHPPTVEARSYHFPERNRLISGLALGVLVVEAGERSGSLITARLALEQGRDVMAVPGSIGNPAARGCHQLLRQGATLVENVAHVLEVLGDPALALLAAALPKRPALVPRRRELEVLLDHVSTEMTSFDEICARSGHATELVAAWLVELELDGFVEQVPGGYIRRPVRDP
jgi:DNA processing protein